MTTTPLLSLLLIGGLSPVFPQTPGTSQPTTCILEATSILGHSPSGVAQVSNLEDMQVRCSLPARPRPSRVGEVQAGLRASAVAYTLPDRLNTTPLEVDTNVFGVGGENGVEWVSFWVLIPLSADDFDAEANSYLQQLLSDPKSVSHPAELDTPEGRRAFVLSMHSVIRQNRTGHFLLECRVKDGNQVLGVGTIELEVLFRGRFSEIVLPR